MRKPGLFLLLLFILTNASAQKATDYRKQQNYKEWVHIAPKFDDDFFKTEEAQRIGDNVLLYQQTTGANHRRMAKKYLYAGRTDRTGI